MYSAVVDAAARFRFSPMVRRSGKKPWNVHGDELWTKSPYPTLCRWVPSLFDEAAVSGTVLDVVARSLRELQDILLSACVAIIQDQHLSHRARCEGHMVSAGEMVRYRD